MFSIEELPISMQDFRHRRYVCLPGCCSHSRTVVFSSASVPDSPWTLDGYREPRRKRKQQFWNVNNPGKQTYGQILKSSVLIGSSSMLNMGLGFIWTKAMAVLLGTTGYGLMGLYGHIQDLTRTVAGVGMNNSGVRQIAAAVGSGDAQRVTRTVTTLRRIAFCTGARGHCCWPY